MVAAQKVAAALGARVPGGIAQASVEKQEWLQPQSEATLSAQDIPVSAASLCRTCWQQRRRWLPLWEQGWLRAQPRPQR